MTLTRGKLPGLLTISLCNHNNLEDPCALPLELSTWMIMVVGSSQHWSMRDDFDDFAFSTPDKKWFA